MKPLTGKLIAVVGNSGVGKTTLVEQLCRVAPLETGLEQIVERPFQALFASDLERYALANQVDYLLYRAEQELALRQRPGVAVQDGGLDQDFYIFTHLFYERGYLTEAEFTLCGRVMAFARRWLPPPDLIILLEAPLEEIERRYAARGRPLEIARREDLVRIERIIRDWTAGLPPERLLKVDASTGEIGEPPFMRSLLEQIGERLAVVWPG